MMLLSLIRKNVKRYWRIARRKKNAKERLNLYDRFCVAEILGDTGINGLNYGLSTFHNGIKGKLPRIKIEDYPAKKAHLDLYWDKISKRTDKGDTPYNLP